ncbi:hypothetical protein ACEPTO_17605 [Pseudomonas aeruginosa]
MSDESMTSQEPLQPLFAFSVTAEPVCLFRGEITLCWEGERHTSEAEVVLKLAPKPRISVESEISGLPASAINLLVNHLPGMTYSLEGQEIQGFVQNFDFNFDNHAKLYISLGAEPFQVLGDMQARASASSIFHLFNFPDFLGKSEYAIPLPAGYRHIALQDEQWQIVIQSLKETKKAANKARQEGGYYLTHVGKLARIDGANFSGDEANEQYHLAANFLSFVQGSRCWPVCIAGLDENGSMSWQTWASPPASTPAQSWFDLHHSIQAEQLFPLFSKRWNQSESWRDCLRSAIYWYIQSNTSGGVPGIDAAIILAQSALERLAHHYLVIDRKMISAEGFRKLWVSDQLRLLFSSLRIPIEITDDIPEIKKVADHLKWKDVPQALTEVRNALVHPENRNKERIRNCYVDTWRLSLWYVELSVLALCGYEGTYGNRLKKQRVGEVENMPWGAEGKLA